MKKLLMIAVLFTGFNVAFAGNENVTEVSLQEQINEMLVYPDYGLQQNMEANVSIQFTLVQNGEIIVTAINGSNDQFKRQILDQINHQLVSVPQELIGKSFEMPVKFDLLGVR